MLSWSASSTAFFTSISNLSVSLVMSASTESSILACQALLAGGRDTAILNFLPPAACSPPPAAKASAVVRSRATATVSKRIFLILVLLEKCFSLPLPPLHEHRKEDDGPFDGPREVRRYIEHDHHVVHDSQDNEADDGAQQAAPAPGEGRAAHDDGGDGLELVLAGGGGRGPRRHAGHLHGGGGSRAQPHPHVGDDQHAVHLDARVAGGAPLAPHGDHA